MTIKQVNGNNTSLLTAAAAVRHASRGNKHTTPTAGQAPGHLQANLIVLPSKYAADFRLLCARNPVPCPLLAESSGPGAWSKLKSHIPVPVIEGERDFDIRTDLPRYNVYIGGELVKQECADIRHEWTPDHVAFLIGCSFSFETDLAAAGLTPRHVLRGGNCPMYRTSIPLNPAGVFTGATYIVSMRTYPAEMIPVVRAITARFHATHGEPLAWGWDAVATLGIRDLDSPDWGDAVVSESGGSLAEVWGNERDVPVFWGCGVTPQEAVMRAGGKIEGVAMGHCPGHMLVLDAVDRDVRA